MQALRLTHSCAGKPEVAAAREAAEADGETATVRYKENGGTAFMNIYTQDASPSGTPQTKVYQDQLLSETGGPENPNNVTDWYDDPRWGHT